MINPNWCEIRYGTLGVVDHSWTAPMLCDIILDCTYVHEARLFCISHSVD